MLLVCYSLIKNDLGRPFFTDNSPVDNFVDKSVGKMDVGDLNACLY